MPAAAQPRHDHRHVGAADRDDQRHADHQRKRDQQEQPDTALGADEQRDAGEYSDAQQNVDRMALGQQYRLAGHPLGEFQKGDDRTGEGDRSDPRAQRHFEQAAAFDVAAGANAESVRREERASGDQHGREADQRVKAGDQFGHRRHRNAPRDGGADSAADPDADDDQQQAREARNMHQQRRRHGDRHADHAVLIALPRGRRRREAAQRENEQNARRQIEKGREIGAHCR